MCCPPPGETLEAFLTKIRGHRGCHPYWYGSVDHITEDNACKWVHWKSRSSLGYSGLRDYQYPLDTFTTISTALESAMSAVSALEEKVGYPVKEIVVYTT